MGKRMNADEMTRELIASLHDEQLMLSTLVSDLYFDARLETDEIKHEMMRSDLRRSSLKAMRNRLLLAGVTR